MHPRLLAYLRLMRMDRPIGAFLLLWPTLWALWLAGSGNPDPDVVVIFIVGTFLMRAAGCVINDYADRGFDAHVERTTTRPLATGELSEKSALILFAVLLVISFLLVLLLNWQTIALSLGGALVAIAYPFVKRISNLPQLVLGIAFSWGIPMAYTALTRTLPIEAWIIFLGNFFWIVAYDTQYAMVDREDDLRIGVKSTAILFGKFDRFIIALLQLAMLITMTFLGIRMGLSWHYYLGLSLAAGFAIYQQTLCFNQERERCFAAFLNNNWLGAMIFFGIVLATGNL